MIIKVNSDLIKNTKRAAVLSLALVMANPFTGKAVASSTEVDWFEYYQKGQMDEVERITSQYFDYLDEMAEEYDQEFTADMLREKLMNNPYLSDKIKHDLYNEDLFNDLERFIYPSEDRGRLLADICYDIENLRLEYEKMTTNEIGKLTIGGYVMGERERGDRIILNDRHKDNEDNIDIRLISHEFLHILQFNNAFAFLTEAVTEMLMSEYYGTSVTSYHKPVIRVKMLMEIIGAKPVINFYFNGGVANLTDEIGRYLPEEETMRFLDLIRLHPAAGLGDGYYQKIDELLSTMYKNKYGIDMTEDPVMAALASYDPDISANTNVERYYFNERKMDDNYVYHYKSVYDLYNEGLIDVKPYVTKAGNISPDKYEEFLQLHPSIHIMSNDNIDEMIEHIDGYIYPSYSFVNEEDETIWFIDSVTKMLVNRESTETISLEDGINRGIIIPIYSYSYRTPVDIQEFFNNEDKYQADFVALDENVLADHTLFSGIGDRKYYRIQKVPCESLKVKFSEQYENENSYGL